MAALCRPSVPYRREFVIDRLPQSLVVRRPHQEYRLQYPGFRRALHLPDHAAGDLAGLLLVMGEAHAPGRVNAGQPHHGERPATGDRLFEQLPGPSVVYRASHPGIPVDGLDKRGVGFAGGGDAGGDAGGGEEEGGGGAGPEAG